MASETAPSVWRIRRAGTTGYRCWAELAGEARAAHDVLYIHIKGPDLPAHDGRWREKVDVIEAIDRSFFAILDIDGAVVLVTADHATSCLRRAHTDQPVPLVVSGPGIAADGVRTLSEQTMDSGSLGHRRGIDLMPWVVGVARGERGW